MFKTLPNKNWTNLWVFLIYLIVVFSIFCLYTVIGYYPKKIIRIASI